MNTICDLVRTFQDKGEQIAIIVDGEPVSYLKFYKDILNVRKNLENRGITSSSSVLVRLKNKYQFLVSIYSVMYSGAIAAPVGDENESNVAEIIQLLEPDLVISDKNSESIGVNFKKLFNDKNNTKHFYGSEIDVSEDDTALILFTSGTTGKRKATELSHFNLLSTSEYINDFMEIEGALTEYICIPLYHSFGFARTRCILLSGGTIIVDNGMFNPRLAVDQLATYHGNAFSGVPAIMALFKKFAERNIKKIKEQIKYIEIGSAPMPVEDKEYLCSAFPEANICMHYGLTEASRTCFINFRLEKNKLSSVGKPSPGVNVKIVDRDKNEVKTGEVGEIAIKGPNVAKSYYNNPKLTSSKFHHGWFYSGDSGYIDEEGYIYFKGRLDDLINVGGKKISPIEIESKIKETGLIKSDFCIVSLPDIKGIYGRVPVICTVDANLGSDNLSKINHELERNGIENIFLPREIKTVEKIPRTHNGKIKRSELINTILQ